ncbi:MAG: 1-deoxy-D-xylulose-5-phosphate reductoisomerase [Tenericutes bacterium HGW-Tenericutes-6]|nr:MAG: 1-deoxy-D-xylulose-5-phosphate reductoisomerase [Tenericutes bacterium HGW-Tenericutes-6]
MKHIYILGAAGSIGLQAIDVCLNHPNTFQIVGLSLGSDDQKNHDILKLVQPHIVCLRSDIAIKNYQSLYPNITFVHGDEGIIELVKYPVKGSVLNALSGSAGLRPTIEAIMSHKDILLANKETLVMAGSLIKDLVKTYNVKLYPIDSEHSAIWQTLRGENIEDVKKLIITASGGSFRHLKRSELSHVTLEDALKHPNWHMGAKITIDSATMMNKGLEVIEAHHLFDLPYNQIETVLHDESMCHGITVFKDGTMKASLSASDMRLPIAYALFYPKRPNIEYPFELSSLSFKPMDFHRFPLLKLAYEVGEKGGLLPTVMNAANEAAVKLFLQKKISFLEIEKIVFETVNAFKNQLNPTLEDILNVDHQIQTALFQAYEKR